MPALQRDYLQINSNRYFGLNASYPKPKPEKVHTSEPLKPEVPHIRRYKSVPVFVNTVGGERLLNDQNPPFSRVAYVNGRLEDSGYQGTFNILRYGGYQLQQYDRSFRPEASKAAIVSDVGEYCEKRANTINAHNANYLNRYNPIHGGY